MTSSEKLLSDSPIHRFSIAKKLRFSKKTRYFLFFDTYCTCYKVPLSAKSEFFYEKINFEGCALENIQRNPEILLRAAREAGPAKKLVHIDQE